MDKLKCWQFDICWLLEDSFRPNLFTQIHSRCLSNNSI